MAWDRFHRIGDQGKFYILSAHNYSFLLSALSNYDLIFRGGFTKNEKFQRSPIRLNRSQFWTPAQSLLQKDSDLAILLAYLVE